MINRSYPVRAFASRYLAPLLVSLLNVGLCAAPMPSRAAVIDFNCASNLHMGDWIGSSTTVTCPGLTVLAYPGARITGVSLGLSAYLGIGLAMPGSVGIRPGDFLNVTVPNEFVQPAGQYPVSGVDYEWLQNGVLQILFAPSIWFSVTPVSSGAPTRSVNNATTFAPFDIHLDYLMFPSNANSVYVSMVARYYTEGGEGFGLVDRVIPLPEPDPTIIADFRPVPEPSTLSLGFLGVALASWIRQRRSRATVCQSVA